MALIIWRVRKKKRFPTFVYKHIAHSVFAYKFSIKHELNRTTKHIITRHGQIETITTTQKNDNCIEFGKQIKWIQNTWREREM